MQDKHEAIISTINSITSSLTSLRELLKDPSDVYFGRLHPAFEHLETVMSKKTTVDAAFAFIAARDDAGRVVGSSKPEDYLTARLGLTYAEAQSRIKTGQSLFAPLAEVSPSESAPSETLPVGEEASDEERKREEAARERDRRERAAAEKRRRQMLEEDAARAKRPSRLSSANWNTSLRARRLGRKNCANKPWRSPASFPIRLCGIGCATLSVRPTNRFQMWMRSLRSAACAFPSQMPTEACSSAAMSMLLLRRCSRLLSHQPAIRADQMSPPRKTRALIRSAWRISWRQWCTTTWSRSSTLTAE